MPADRPLDIDVDSHFGAFVEVTRDFAIRQLFYQQVIGTYLFRGRCDRIAAARLIAIFGGQSDVQMLACLEWHPNIWSYGDLQDVRACRFQGDHFGLLPVIRLRTHSQKRTVAARAMAERKTVGHRS